VRPRSEKIVNQDYRGPDGHQRERALALGYARPQDRAALTTLFAIDARLGGIVRGTREPMVGQMRLTWWYEALAALDTAAAPAEPLLREVAATLLPRGVTGGELAMLVEGWEPLLDAEVLDEATLLDVAASRGGRLFTLAARLLGADDAVATIGEGWALADLAIRWSEPATAARAAALARTRLTTRRWSRAARPLGALALLAAADLRERRAPGSPRRVARLLVHRLTGW
jgi:phytoene synthase